jgi:hypothetical protein
VHFKAGASRPTSSISRRMTPRSRSMWASASAEFCRMSASTSTALGTSALSEGLTLVHSSAQRKHPLRSTLGGFRVSVTKSVSGSLRTKSLWTTPMETTGSCFLRK